MRSAWTKEQSLALLGVSSAEEMLRMALAERESEGKPVRYADLARRAGFSSRGFARDVALGKKALTLDAAARFAKAIQLPADLADLMVDLVQWRDKGAPGTKESAKLQARIEKRKCAIRARLSPPSISGDQAYQVENISLVFAALGSPDKGARLGEIERRTGLGAPSIEAALGKLIEFGLCEARADRYFAVMNIVAFQQLQAGGGFQETFLRRVKKMETLARTQFNHDYQFFWEGSLSIRLADLPQLQSELKRLLGDFVGRAESGDGEKVVSIVSGMFTP